MVFGKFYNIKSYKNFTRKSYNKSYNKFYINQNINRKIARVLYGSCYFFYSFEKVVNFVIKKSKKARQILTTMI